jgi:Large polyvalent protein-associated domain 7
VFPALTWDQFLANRTQQGNAEALTILRKRKNYRQQISKALLTVENFEDARDIIKPHFKPTVLKNGNVVYRAQDGGVVLDEATAVCVQEMTEGATLLALSLAEERFHGKALVVEGSIEFKAQIARLSTLQGLSIRFAEPALEKDRQRHVRAKELTQQGRKETTQQKSKQPEHELGRDYREG